MKTLFLIYTFLVAWLVPVGAYAAEVPVVEPAGREFVALLDFLEAHPVFFTLVLWPLVTGALSYAQDTIQKRWPGLWRFLRAAGLDAAGLQRWLVAWVRARRPRAPPPDGGGGSSLPPSFPSAGPPAGSARVALAWGLPFVVLVGCASPIHGLVVTADSAATTAEAARPVLKGACTDPMIALAGKALEVKDDAPRLAKLKDDLVALMRRCDPAIDAQDTLLRLHAALRAAIVALHAGAPPADAAVLAGQLIEAATRLSKSLVALGGAK